MLEGMNTDLVDARGNTPLAHMWTLILFGDYMAYYLAMGYGVDPTPIQALVDFKTGDDRREITKPSPQRARRLGFSATDFTNRHRLFL